VSVHGVSVEDWGDDSCFEDSPSINCSRAERGVGCDGSTQVCLVGDMITEEALPTYMNMLNTLVSLNQVRVCCTGKGSEGGKQA
jgi:hypothetical protein